MYCEICKLHSDDKKRINGNFAVMRSNLPMIEQTQPCIHLAMNVAEQLNKHERDRGRTASYIAKELIDGTNCKAKQATAQQ